MNYNYCINTTIRPPLVNFSGYTSGLSARLFRRFEPKKHVLQKAGATCAFWAKANNMLRTRKPYGAEEVHKIKSPVRVCNYLLALPSITKLPLIKVLSSHA